MAGMGLQINMAFSLHRLCLPPALPLVRSLARSFAPALPLVYSLARSFARARALSEAGMPAKCESAWIIPTSQSIQQSSVGRQLFPDGCECAARRCSTPPAVRHPSPSACSPSPSISCCPSARAPCPTLCRSADAWCVSTCKVRCMCRLRVRDFFYFFPCKPPDAKPPFLAKVAVSDDPI